MINACKDTHTHTNKRKNTPVPETHGAILTRTDDHRQTGVEAHTADVVAVALQGLQTGFGLVVPDFDGAVIGTGQQIRLVSTCR